MDFNNEESKDGVRLSWNVLPTAKADALKLSVPIAAMYTPLKQHAASTQQPDGTFITTNTSITVPYPPIVCKNDKCASLLNPYCQVDYMTKVWVCAFCLQRNNFPLHYSDISPENTPAELLHQYTSMEYVITQPQQQQMGGAGGDSQYIAQPPIFLFVIDTCVYSEELVSLKKSLIQSLLLMPENALVGLISYGRNVHIHEINWDEGSNKSYVFRGNKNLAANDIQKMLNFRHAQTVNQADGKHAQQQQAQLNAQSSPRNNVLRAQMDQQNRNRFLLPVSECEYQLTQVLESLDIDRWSYKAGERQDRATGAAMSIAVGLLELTCKSRNARIMSFVGGPCTVGPGQVASNLMKQTIRSHIDINKNNVPYYRPAIKFYDELANRAVENGHIIDLFACSLDQIGVAEMKACCSVTGGYLVLDDSFTHNVFNGSFRRLFARDAVQADSSGGDAGTPELSMAFGGELQVTCSRELKVTGCIGHVSSLHKEAPHVGKDKEIGIGQTCLWSLGGVDPTATYCVYFDVTGTAGDGKGAQARAANIQFVTRYKHSNGSVRLRVTTIARMLADGSTQEGINYLRAGFDQECAAVVLARFAVFKLDAGEYIADVIRWIDKSLITLVTNYARYQKNDPNSFQLSDNLAYFPQFLFHLRRSQFIQIFNSSPDETTFFRHTLLRENTMNSVIMVQPMLSAYSLQGPVQPVNLDVSSIRSDVILLLDTFFHIVVWYGDTIAQWRAQQLHLQDEYAYLNVLLTTPVTDAQQLIDARFPSPRFIECVEKGSQSRFLMAKLNPSISHTSVQQQQYGANGQPVEAPVFTEDVSMKVFMQFLRKLAVASEA